MANYTTNYNLYKPDIADADIEVAPSLKTNFESIDTELKNRQNELEAHQTAVNAHESVNIKHGDGNVQETLFGFEARISGAEEDITDVDQRISSIVAQAGNDNTEIVDARGGFTVLRNRFEGIEDKTESHGIIKVGIDAGKNAPTEPVYTGDNKFYKNLAIGGYAMQNSVASWNNIAIGWNTMNALTKGEYYNIGIGNESLYYTKKPEGDTDPFTASRNIGIGMNALRFNVKGYQNAALGRNALQCTVDGNKNTAIGVNAMSGNGPLDLTGQIANLTPSNASENVAVGFNALALNEENNNTAVGSNALSTSVKGTGLTAVGFNTLKSLQSNVDPSGNKKYTYTKTGTYVWTGTTVTISIVAHGLLNGYKVSLSLLTGDIKSTEKNIYTIANVTADTFTITAPIEGNTSGNCATDWYSDNTLPDATANNATAVGAYALENPISGENNTAIGAYTLRNATGVQNTAIGGLAGTNITTGQNNTALGYNALRYLQDGTNHTTYSNTTGLGFNSRVSGSNQVQLGGSGQTSYAFGAVQDRSDMRDKTEIRDTALGLEFINKLRPVDFKWDYRDDYIEIDEETGEVIRYEKDGSRKRNRYHHGLIAQEVKQVIDETGVDFGGFQDHKVNGGNDVLSIGYTELIAPLIKAVQELTERVKELESR